MTCNLWAAARDVPVGHACRIQRDVASRGRDIGSVIEQYTRSVKPMFDQFVAPSRRHADLIIPWSRWVSSFACTALPVLWARQISCLYVDLQGRELGSN